MRLNGRLPAVHVILSGRKDIIVMSTGYLWDKASLTQFMHKVIEDFDYHDLNVISKRQLEVIITLSQTANPLCKDIITEDSLGS